MDDFYKYDQNTYDIAAQNLALVKRHMEPWLHELLVSLFNIDFSVFGKDYDEAAFKAACQVIPPNLLAMSVEDA